MRVHVFLSLDDWRVIQIIGDCCVTLVLALLTALGAIKWKFAREDRRPAIRWYLLMSAGAIAWVSWLGWLAIFQTPPA